MASPPVLVDVTAPPAWLIADDAVEHPKIAESAGASLTDWHVRRAPDDAAMIAWGCVRTPIPGWVDDMLPQVDMRTRALAGDASSKIARGPIDARTSDDPAHLGRDILTLRSANDLEGPRIGVAHTFIGFEESPASVHTCFATCVRRSSPKEGTLEDAGLPALAPTLGCQEAVVRATLVGSTAPPAPGIALRGVTWGVHHPRPAAYFAAILLTIATILAIVVRRRPRSG